MTQNVTLEDGSVHSFPDDATPEEMNDALASAAPPPAPIPAMQNFTNAATKGFKDLGLGIMSAGANMGAGIGYIPQEQADANKQLFAQTKQGLDVQYPTQPGISNWLGKTLGQNAPALLVPGGPLAAGAAFGATDALSNEDPAIGGADQALDVGKNAAESAALSKAGDLALNGVATLGSKALNMAKGLTSPIMDAYNRLGISTDLTGDVTNNPFLKSIQAYAHNQPNVVASSKNALNQFGNAVENTASQLGNSTTLQEAGNALQDSGTKWLNNFKDQSATNWNAVNGAVGSATPVPMDNTRAYLQSLSAQGGNNPAAQDFLTSDLAKRFQNIVDVSDKSNLPVTWDTIKGLRTRAGQYLENPQLIADAGGAQAKGLYGALTADMKQAVQSSPNPDAASLFDNANQYTAQGHDFIDGVLGKAMNTDPEKAANSLLQSGLRGGSQLQALRAQMPDAADELGAASLRRMAAGESTGASNAVSPSRWLSNQDPVRRLSPEAKNALFPDPVVQANMSDLDTVANTMRSTEKLVNHSNTNAAGETASLLKLPRDVAIGFLAGHEVGGVPGGVIGGISGALPYASGPAASLLGSSPALAKFVSTPASNLPFSFAPSLTSALTR